MSELIHNKNISNKTKLRISEYLNNLPSSPFHIAQHNAHIHDISCDKFIGHINRMLLIKKTESAPKITYSTEVNHHDGPVM